MEFWMSSDRPAPERKRKQVTSALEEHEEYLKLRTVILSGRMRPNQQAIITMGPDDAKKMNYKWPWRTAVDSLRRFVKSMNLETEYAIRKFETATPGVWAITVTYDPPMGRTGTVQSTRGAYNAAQEAPQASQVRRAPGRPRKSA